MFWINEYCALTELATTAIIIISRAGVTKTQTPKTRTSDPENSDPENSDPENSDPLKSISSFRKNV